MRRVLHFTESFGWILLNSEFICVIGTIPSYLDNWGKRVNFGNGVTEIQQKYERERKSGREKILNFGNHITEIPAAQIYWPKTNCDNTIAEIGEKKNCGNCGNAIAENGREKKIMVAKIWGGIKKKKCYVHNIFTIFSQQIIDD